MLIPIAVNRSKRPQTPKALMRPYNEWRSQPLYVWAATNKPHMMACIRHHYEHDDDILFVSEIQVMVALMIVRLAKGSFPGHNIVPVMLFSYTADKRGRILQAHMTSSSLVF
jgi:hypothetical protein